MVRDEPDLAGSDIGRHRDIFPLPLLPHDLAVLDLLGCKDLDNSLVGLCVRLASLTVWSLNVLCGVKSPAARVGKAAPQLQSQGLCLLKSARMIRRLSRAD